MKKIFILPALLLAFICCGLNTLQAQTFKALGPKIYVFDTVHVNHNLDHTFKVINLTANKITIDWYQLKSQLPSAWSSQVCDNNNCYAANMIPKQSTPASASAITNKDTLGLIGSWKPTSNSAMNDTLILVVFDHNNPTYKDTFTAVFTQATTGIEAATYGTLSFNINPNPVKDLIKIYTQNLHAGKVEIFNLNGQCLSTQMMGNFSSASINAEMLKPGIYILKYTDLSGNFGTRKFIKE